ncbi:Urease accessory protein UreF [Methylophaga frappieri]|uniref:Urease accessory protein UreF n=2 Tax=Methylophaga frappieri (strain ATCC BAA-2434 / DSM 25690 / JAM7) TaxID=754477 RepID=I1YJC3_METFJ|nr:Urease accessory protein UreF [Methylophaga frappieri]
MLPVGAYSYSQGLEWAIETAVVKDVRSASTWIEDVLSVYYANFELPVLLRLYQAWQHQNLEAIQYWDAFYQAGRDSREALAETQQMAYSLLRLQDELATWPAPICALTKQLKQPAFPTIFSLTAYDWAISQQHTLHAYAWSFLENQVSAIMKAVPLGQVAGQRILSELGQIIPTLITEAMQLPEDEIHNFCPALSIAGCRHETQYSRLFRS